MLWYKLAAVGRAHGLHIWKYLQSALLLDSKGIVNQSQLQWGINIEVCIHILRFYFSLKYISINHLVKTLRRKHGLCSDWEEFHLVFLNNHDFMFQLKHPGEGIWVQNSSTSFKMFSSLFQCLSLGDSLFFQDSLCRHQDSFYLYSSFTGFHSIN